MARAYKCDICRNLFEKRISLNICNKSSLSVVSNDYVEKRIDICPECIAAIQKVIDERALGTMDGEANNGRND